MPAIPFRVRALYAYSSEYEDDLNFETEAIITVTSIEEDGWYFGKYTNPQTGKVKEGMFPQNFVEIINEPVVPSRPRHKNAESIAVPTPESTTVPEPVPEPVAVSTPDPSTETPKPKKTNDFFSKIATFNTTNAAPVLPSAKPKEESHVQKPFYGGKSSYIPPGFGSKKPSVNTVSNTGSTEENSKEIVRESHDEEVIDQPKMSLKERIALLEKTQKEEAEREAASAKKSVEKKKKKKSQVVPPSSSDSATPPVLGSEEPGSNTVSRKTTKDEDSFVSTEDLPETAIPAPAQPQESVEEVEQEEEAGEEDGDENEDEHVEEEEEEEEDDDEDDDEEEDDEEAHRRKLRERMAKLSGGAGMFGMMGMSPFGGAPASKKKSKPESEPVDEEYETAKPVPIIPLFGSAPPVPGTPSRSSTQDSTTDDIASNVSEIREELDDESFDSAKEDLKDTTIEPIDEEKAVELPVAAAIIEAPSVTDENAIEESDSEVEEEDEEELEEAEEHRDITASSIPIPITESDIHESSDASNANNDSHVRAIDLDKQKILSDGETTGYEGDEDSDRHELVNSKEIHEATHENLHKSAPPPIPVVPAPVVSAPPPPAPQSAAPSIPAPQSSAPPLPPSIPAPIPGAVPRSQTVPESYSQKFSEIPSNLNRRDSLVHSNRRQSVDSKRMSIDSYRSFAANTSGNVSGSLELTQTNYSEDVFGGALNIDVYETVDWWQAKKLPPSLEKENNKTLIYDVADSETIKRGGIKMIIRDYYILYMNEGLINQELITVTFNPNNLHIVSFQIQSLPINKSEKQPGLEVYKLASKYNGHTIDAKDKFVGKLYGKLSNILVPPIGDYSYGNMIYQNESHRNVTQIEDFQPGDILRISKARFNGHNKLHQKIVYEVGVSEPLVAVINEFDNSKLKFRVLEKDSKNKIKPVSYKITDLISGSIKVFRPIGKEEIGW